MKTDHARIVVAGHICLDIIPSIPSSAGGLSELLVPGKLIDVGAAVVATGGAVSNTGVALHRLGMPVELMGKVGSDPFGRIVLDVLRADAEELAAGMIVSGSDQTSYTLVINPPGVDRMFLHCPGANNTFTADNIDYKTVAQSSLFHFGYPPLMASMYEKDGKELVEIFRRVKALGVTTSLDMALPDPNSPAGKANWPTILKSVLPYVDLFLPSLDEIVFMMGDGEFERQPGTAADVSRRLIDMGAAIVLVKLGDKGAFLETTQVPERILQMGTCRPGDLAAWCGVSLHSTCYEVEVVGTTGAGDCAIAGFLAAVAKGMNPEEALSAAVAAGACGVEAANATGGILPWDKMQWRINSGWKKVPAE